MVMAKKVTKRRTSMAKSKSVSKPTTKKKNSASLAKVPRFSRRSLTLFGAFFAIAGGFLLYRAFAATAYYNWYGELTAKNPNASYSLTTGRGLMDVSFSNNTADVTLTITNKAGTVIGKLDSRGKKDVKLSTSVTPDTYTFKLTTEKAFKSKKGYSVKINYPELDTIAPAVIITRPLNQATLSGDDRISAIATDDDGIKDVKFYVGDTLLKTDTTFDYSTPWDTRTSPDGQVTIRVVATDVNGNVGEASGTVFVDNVQDNSEAAGSRFPGDPNTRVTKKAYWGASIAGNGDPVARHESVTGTSLSIRRTFWQWDNATNMTSNMYRTIENDLANNRLPFISTKTPSWADMGSGKHDAEIDAMLRKLDSYGKPIWYVAHHEPEGGGASGNTPDDPGGPAAWRAMQTRIRQRMNAIGTKNIAFMPVVMTYTWETASKRDPDAWWVDGIWDAYCVDHYNFSEGNNMLDDKHAWVTFNEWLKKKNLPTCLGEWGNTGTDTKTGQEMRDFWNYAFNSNAAVEVIAYSYFDSNLNSSQGGWELKGEPLNVFRDILKNDPKVQRINDL